MGFTALAARLSPEALVELLEECFTAIDEIMDRHGVTKLKTIGDAYMAVGGLPVRNETHAHDVVAAARRLGLPVVMVCRPPVEPGPRVDSVESALAWLVSRASAP